MALPRDLEQRRTEHAALTFRNMVATSCMTHVSLTYASRPAAKVTHHRVRDDAARPPVPCSPTPPLKHEVARQKRSTCRDAREAARIRRHKLLPFGDGRAEVRT